MATWWMTMVISHLSSDRRHQSCIASSSLLDESQVGECKATQHLQRLHLSLSMAMSATMNGSVLTGRRTGDQWFNRRCGCPAVEQSGG
jgi:hypothetical protein